MTKTPFARPEKMGRIRRKTCIEDLLEDFPWPNQLESQKAYRRLQDDHDGEGVGQITVGILENGDAWISMDVPKFTPLRFRTLGGGGNSIRVRNALVMLALAIHLDEQEEKAKIARQTKRVEENQPKSDSSA